jgi:hypothetical protein
MWPLGLLFFNIHDCFIFNIFIYSNHHSFTDAQKRYRIIRIQSPLCTCRHTDFCKTDSLRSGSHFDAVGPFRQIVFFPLLKINILDKFIAIIFIYSNITDSTDTWTIYQINKIQSTLGDT